MDTAMAMPRALNEPVGKRDSSLMSRFRGPAARPGGEPRAAASRSRRARRGGRRPPAAAARRSATCPRVARVARLDRRQRRRRRGRSAPTAAGPRAWSGWSERAGSCRRWRLRGGTRRSGDQRWAASAEYGPRHHRREATPGAKHHRRASMAVAEAERSGRCRSAAGLDALVPGVAGSDHREGGDVTRARWVGKNGTGRDRQVGCDR